MTSRKDQGPTVPLLMAIKCFRLGMEAAGSNALTEFIDQLMPMMECNPCLAGEHELSLFNEIISAQERGDLIYVADLLQYQLPASALGRCIQSG